MKRFSNSPLAIARRVAADACGKAQMALRTSDGSDDAEATAGHLCGEAISAITQIRDAVQGNRDIRSSTALRFAAMLERLGDDDDINNETLASAYEAVGIACEGNRIV